MGVTSSSSSLTLQFGVPNIFAGYTSALIAFWVNVTTWNHTFQRLVYKSTASTSGFAFQRNNANDQIVVAAFGSSTETDVSCGVTIAGQGWLHIAAYINSGTPTLRGYRNGVFVANSSTIRNFLTDAAGQFTVNCDDSKVAIAQLGIWVGLSQADAEYMLAHGIAGGLAPIAAPIKPYICLPLNGGGPCEVDLCGKLLASDQHTNINPASWRVARAGLADTVAGGYGEWFPSEVVVPAWYPESARRRSRFLAQGVATFPTIYTKSSSASLVLTATSAATSLLPRDGSASVVVAATCSQTAEYPRDGSAALVLAADSGGIVTHATGGLAIVVLAATADGSSLLLRDGSASLVLTATADVDADLPRSGTATVVLTATASEVVTLDPDRLASLSVLFLSAAAAAIHGIGTGASADLVFTASAAAEGGEQTATVAGGALLVLRARARFKGGITLSGEPEYLGRYQVGSEFQFHEGTPDRAPDAYQVMDLPGRHLVISYSRGGSGNVVARAAVYEVVGGGDPAGAILVAHALPGPAVDRALAQAESGVLLAGESPYLEGT